MPSLHILATLQIQQLQALVLAICAAAIIVVPIIGGVAVAVVVQYGRIKEAIGKVNAQNGTVEYHTAALLQQGQILADVSGRVTGMQTKMQTMQADSQPPPTEGTNTA